MSIITAHKNVKVRVPPITCQAVLPISPSFNNQGLYLREAFGQCETCFRSDIKKHS
jgi:hypothetical protein